MHVVNCQSKDIEKEYDVVESVLEKIGAKDVPVITVLNKCDEGYPTVCPSGVNPVYVSALTGEGIPALKETICLALFGEIADWE